jgi:general secretion pathway protein G
MDCPGAFPFQDLCGRGPSFFDSLPLVQRGRSASLSWLSGGSDVLRFLWLCLVRWSPFVRRAGSGNCLLPGMRDSNSSFRTARSSLFTGALALGDDGQMTFHRSRTRQRAITRAEIILGVLVLGLLVATVCPKIFARNPGTTAALAQIATFKVALEAFQQDTGYLPRGTNGLLELLRQPPSATNWHGPYLDRIPQDPWGRDYVYKCPGKHTASGYPYDLICLGPPGEDSPIVNWESMWLRP